MIGTESSVEIDGVTKRFGDVTAVDAVSFSIRRGEFFSLLGPSGCGKTTLLRMIAGFETPSEGSIAIGGAGMNGVPPYRRPVNMVFQHYAIFPHLSVRQNVGFGLRYQRLSLEEQDRRVAESLELVRLPEFGGRSPDELSGGQRQRVALARALAVRPTVLLLDEPLGALDRMLRKEMQVELKTLQRTLGITFVFVTHDQEEALTMSDRIAVMNLGRVEQLDAAAAVFERPRTEFVATFMGAPNFFAGRVVGREGEELAVELAGGVRARIALAPGAPPPGPAVRFVVRPEKLTLRTGGDPPSDAFLPVTVEERVYQGINTMWIVRDAQKIRFVVYEQNTRPFSPDAGPGAPALLGFRPEHAVLMES